MQKKSSEFRFAKYKRGSIPYNLVLLLLLLCSVVFQTKGQGVGVNNNGVSPDPSAVLDIKSSDKGFLIPRMTTAQMNAIHLPAQSLIVYNTTTNCFYIFIASWLPLNCVCAGVPATPGVITPSNASPAACTAGVTYSVALVGGATSYNWTIPFGAIITAGQGTNIITVTLGSTSGVVGVQAINSCGTSGISSLPVTVTNGTHGTISFSYTGSLQTWTVPPCISIVTIVISGAGGGSSASYSPGTSAGGSGATINASVVVQQGEILNIFLGQQGLNSTSSCDGGAGGTGGFNNDEAGGPGYGDTNNTPWYNLPGWGAGGGGGGASSIRVGGTSIINRVIVAGAGGGGGADYNVESYGPAFGVGGDGGQPGTNGAGKNINERGKAGTLIAGGAATVMNTGGCNPPGETSFPGGFGFGGHAGMSKITCEWGGGGGGGGGYYGGSGGCGGGGGGGYSYVGGTGVTQISITAGANAGNGSATITW